MEFISILNDIMGPVMRGPSSSHTAGSYRIGRMARSLFGECPSEVTFQFDPGGSYGKVYREQGADLAFISGILNWPITDERFLKAEEWAVKEGVQFLFEITPLESADHPNTVRISMASRSGKKLDTVAKSVGGGIVVFTKIEDYDVNLTGKAYEYIVLTGEKEAPRIIDGLNSKQRAQEASLCRSYGSKKLYQFNRSSPYDSTIWAQIKDLPGVIHSWSIDPVFYVRKGKSLFSSAREMLDTTKNRGCTLGQASLLYEAEILGLNEPDIRKEIKYRLEIMKASMVQGERGKGITMQLLVPSAHEVIKSAHRGQVAIGGIHTKAAARAMAVCHVNNSMGVVCAAPTGGSSGVIPAVLFSMAEEFDLDESQIVMGFLAASAIGVIIAKRATFAAEIAGCQVEIGAAGAMAAAAVVEMAGGTAEQATNAAAIALQNTMGSVCDLVQGICELPCHTRNAAAASSAFVCADLILGGYPNPIPLDETVDAALRVGEMLPAELRCTALGGIATAPAAMALPKLR